jgi:hypothetical protein
VNSGISCGSIGLSPRPSARRPWSELCGDGGRIVLAVRNGVEQVLDVIPQQDRHTAIVALDHWSDGLVLTVDRCEPGPGTPVLRAAKSYPDVAGSGDKQAKAKLCCVEIDEVAVAFGPPT